MHMNIPAYAKVNLTLKIIGKRDDGFHALESVMQLITLEDRLTIRESDDMRFTCSVKSLETNANLVLRAARILQQSCLQSRGVHIHLEKNIPVQAGLGGGSSDAATTLSALNEFWGIRLPNEALRALGAELGSDVPFFLGGPCAITRGRGEHTSMVHHAIAAAIVLVKPAAGLSTPLVYQQLHVPKLCNNHLPGSILPETQIMLDALQSGNLEKVALAMCNDLEEAAFALMPELLILRERLLTAGARAVVLCGSGSALMGLCDNDDIAQHVARELRRNCPWTWAGKWQHFR